MRVERHYLEAELRRLIRIGNDRNEHKTHWAGYGYVLDTLESLKKGGIISWHVIGGENEIITAIDVGLPDGNMASWDTRRDTE